MLSLPSYAGCGGASKMPSDTGTTPSEAPAAGGEAEVSSAEPTTVDDAAADFESAEADLQGLITANESNEEAPTPGASDAPRASPYAQARGRGRCARACRALASMRRSASRLCHLTGDEDPRCVNVVDRLEQAEQRVEATCPVCGA